jgi:hypothetical protein
MLMHRHSPLATRWILVLIASFVGCSESDRRFEFKGQVKLDGAPLQKATLILTPKGSGQAVAASILDGKFEVPENLGPTAGYYDVRINPLDGSDDPESFLTHARDGKNKQRIPKAYQKDGNLSVSIQGTPGETFTFELKSSAQ